MPATIDHAVAGDDDLERIAVQGVPDGADRIWASDGFGHLLVSPHLAVGNLARDFENFFLELGPINFDRNRKLAELACEVQIKFVDRLAIGVTNAVLDFGFRVGTGIGACLYAARRNPVGIVR